MATLPGKTDRYRPNDPSWHSQPFYGGFMPSIVPDQVVAKSLPSVVDRTFAALGPLEPQRTSVASIRPNWTVPTWGAPNRMDVAAMEKQKADAGSLDSLLAYASGIPDLPAVTAASSLANPAVTSVQGKMLPKRTNGGLLEMLFGPSKNGMSGLPGLLGGPNAGGILGSLTSQKAATPRHAVNHKAARDAAERSGQTVSGSASSSGRYYNFDSNSWM